MSPFLAHVTAADFARPRRSERDLEALVLAAQVVEDVRQRGLDAVREHAERFGDLAPGADLVVERPALERAFEALPEAQQHLLQRTAAHIRAFAERQRACLLPLDVAVPGGRAGHRWLPVRRVGAYAPGGRHPLPSSVLMTVVPARTAGVEEVVVASPKPVPMTLAAAHVAGADRLLAVGGAQAIAALAFGCTGSPVDVVVGPGNRYVTAAKRCLVGEVGIDGLAGPSELLVLTDGSASARLVAADLLAQAEHDVDAAPWLVTTDAAFVDAVERELARQLADLPTREVARAALLANGRAVVARDRAEAIALADARAPEHLELCVADPERWIDGLTAYGSLFVGAGSAEVYGDYGAGPNHVLPTGGGARFQAGLSVLTFLRPATHLAIDDPRALAADCAALARCEGLEGHARAAEARLDRRP